MWDIAPFEAIDAGQRRGFVATPCGACSIDSAESF